jgi:hypothetical protein
MTDVATTEITPGRLAVTVVTLIGHPVAAKVRNRFLVLVAINTVASLVTGGASAAIMGRFNPVTGGFQAKLVIFWFFGLVALFAKRLTVRVAVGAGV